MNWKSVRDVDVELPRCDGAPCVAGSLWLDIFRRAVRQRNADRFATYNPMPVAALERAQLRERKRSDWLPENLRRLDPITGSSRIPVISVMPGIGTFYQEFPLSTGKTFSQRLRCLTGLEHTAARYRLSHRPRRWPRTSSCPYGRMNRCYGCLRGFYLSDLNVALRIDLRLHSVMISTAPEISGPQRPCCRSSRISSPRSGLVQRRFDSSECPQFRPSCRRKIA